MRHTRRRPQIIRSRLTNMQEIASGGPPGLGPKSSASNS